MSLVGNMQSAVEHVLGLGDGRCVLASDRAGALRLFDVRRGVGEGAGLQAAQGAGAGSGHCIELLSGRGSCLKSGPFWVTPGERAVAVTMWVPDGGLCGGQSAERSSSSYAACVATSPLLEVRSLRTGSLVGNLTLTEKGEGQRDCPRARGAWSLKLCPNDVHAFASGDWGWDECWGVGGWRAGPNEGGGRDTRDAALRLMRVRLVGCKMG